ncbi:MAG: DUF3800 domain-containing protein [Alistipes sp.]|nr:DUF3800 domain-containing protein [Alistipes senegalensis]MCM1251043.1 DUF3800 domain-containing protein [Alistipes sp.]
MEYIIYCDESISSGKYYSDFYGGVLVRSPDLDFVKTSIDNKKTELNLLGEIKWTKVTENYLQKYMQIMDLFFDFIRQDKVKIRIMFRQSAQIPINLTQEQKENGFHLLYYQFVKHAFGLRFHRADPTEDTYIRLYFDKLPDTHIQNEAFKSHIYGLQGQPIFQHARLKIRMDDIVEIDSKDHSIQQCMDIILGAMAFRLNNMHKEKPEGARQRGKKTIAKEKLYRHILSLIKSIGFPYFNIGISTGTAKLTDRWNHSYRHWKFVPSEFKEDR